MTPKPAEASETTELDPGDAIFSAPPDFHRTGLSSRGYYAGAEKVAPINGPLTGIRSLSAGTREQQVRARYHTFEARQRFWDWSSRNH